MNDNSSKLDFNNPVYVDVKKAHPEYNLHYTKEQHYVSRCYLKHFANVTKIDKDGEKTYKTFTIPEQSDANGIKIDKVCKRNFTFGEDCLIESALSEMEDKVCPIIQYVVDMEEMPDDIGDQCQMIELLVGFYHRSIRIYDQQKLYLRTILDNFTVLKGITDYQLFTKIEDKPNLLVMLDGSWKEMIQYMGISLLKNDTKGDFITSDCPFCVYNPLIIKESNTWYSITSPGVIWYCPLSSKLSLLMYDLRYYKKIDEKILIKDVNTITELNKLEVMNSYQRIIYQDNCKTDYAKSIYEIKSTNKEIDKEMCLKTAGIGFCIKNIVNINYLEEKSSGVCDTISPAKICNLKDYYNKLIKTWFINSNCKDEVIEDWDEYFKTI